MYYCRCLAWSEINSGLLQQSELFLMNVLLQYREQVSLVPTWKYNCWEKKKNSFSYRRFRKACQWSNQIVGVRHRFWLKPGQYWSGDLQTEFVCFDLRLWHELSNDVSEIQGISSCWHKTAPQPSTKPIKMEWKMGCFYIFEKYWSSALKWTLWSTFRT